MLKQPFTDVKNAYCHFVSLYGDDTVEQRERYAAAFEKFKNKYNATSAYIASSSGRVEVIGNHTDHNGGLVLCSSISLDTLAMFLPTDDGMITVSSEGYKDFQVDVNDIKNDKISNSRSLVKGVVAGFKERGFKVGGFKTSIESNVIGGAGISSSASFEVLIAEILNFLYNDGKVSQEEKAYISQFAEREYFGKPCGLLDQSAISFGGLNKIDFSDENKMVVTKIDNNIGDFSFVLVNTGSSHANLTDEYASIPQEMKQVASCFGKKRLSEVNENLFLDNITTISDKVSDRAILRSVHFYEENKRVLRAERGLLTGDFKTFAEAENDSGISSLCKLQNCYVGGSTEQPIPKAIALLKEIIDDGAVRIHGGGFAGCVLCIVKNDKLKRFIEDAKRFYRSDCIIPLAIREKGTLVL